MLEKSYPFVSIALCTYNGSEFLAEQLQSVLNQDYPNYELVIVDDKSTDNTCEIITSYLSDSRIRFYINDSNLGYASNFSKALSLCEGEFIALSDQDDVWLPEKISLMVSKMDGLSGLYHNSAFMNGKGELNGLKLTDKVRFVAGTNPDSLLLYNYVGGHTLMINREIFQHALPIPKGVYHDWWLAFVCMNLKGLSYIEKPLVHYRIHNTNETVLAEERKKITTRDTKHERRAKRTRKIAELIYVLKTFSRSSFIKHTLKDKIDRLLYLQKGRLRTYFSFPLFLFLINNMKIYQSGHRGYLGKLNAIRKDSMGTC